MGLKEIRNNRKLKQKQVADALGCSAVVYSRYETGDREPSIETLLRLADVFGVTVDYMLGRQQIEHSTLSSYEIELIEASREADSRAREDAMTMLKAHSLNPDKKGKAE